MGHSTEGERLLAEFSFLVDQFDFAQNGPKLDAERHGIETEYARAPLRIAAAYNDRDGHDVSLLYPSRGPNVVSIGVLASSLSLTANPASAPATAYLRMQSAFVRSHLDALLTMPYDIYQDCCALRFFHSAKWRGEWGSGIVMDAPTMSIESARLNRLREYFRISET